MSALKPFNGTWFEFQHHSIAEGVYWNPTCRNFTHAQWQEKVREISSLGMRYLVLMCTSLPYEEHAESYFDTTIYPFAPGMVCADPIEAMLSAADECNMKVFISCGFYGVWFLTKDNMTSPDVTRRAFQSMEELYGRYGNHPSFYGWYYPDETEIYPRFSDNFVKYVETYSAFAHSLDATKKKLIAPFGTNKVITDDAYVRQLEKLPVDIVAYQDEVGVRKSTPQQTAIYYEALRKAHDRAGRSALWCDMEVFEFEGNVQTSPLIPAPIDRIRQQLKSVSPFVDEVLIYQYQGMFNRPGTNAFCGHPGSYELYNAYRKLMALD